MIQIKDNFGVVRPPKPGERFAMKDGRIYTVDRAGSLIAVKGDSPAKRLTSGKQKRKERRAAELAKMKRKSTIAVSSESQ